MVCGSNGWWIPFLMIHYFVFMDEFSWNKTNRTLVIIMDEVIIKRMYKPFIYIAELPRCGPDRTGRGSINNNTLPKFCTGRFVSLFTPALHKRSSGGARTHTHSLSRGIGDCPQFLALGLHKQLSKIVAHQEREEFKQLLLFWAWRNG
jgi:hypothetical protein